MKIKALTLALFAAGLLTGLTLIAPATGADPPTTTSGTTTSGTTTSAATTTTTAHTTTPTTTTTPAATTTAPNYTYATDPISALGSTSITVGPLTCSIGSSSPGTGDFKVGVRVRIYCSNGVLISIKADTPATTTTTTSQPPTTTTTTPTNYTSATDGITALSSTSITVGQLTCAIGISSPHTGDFKVGDRARIYCASGVLAYLIRPEAPATTTTTTTNTTAPIAPIAPTTDHHDDVTTTRLGTISALNTASITVDGLTCTIGSSSPSLSAFRLGDQVGIGCTNGALVKIGAPQVDDGGFKVVVQLGSIVALGTGSITVGNLTCSLATSSPSVASYEVGDRVGVGCAGGILFMIGTLPRTDSVSKTEVKHALVERFKGCIKHGSEKCTVNGILHRLAHK
jgi:hypothetical protein